MGLTMRLLVTGGAGYVGSGVVRELLNIGAQVSVLDSLLHGQQQVAGALERAGALVVRGDIRDADARRTALDGADALVHLAAIVGDPACARDPKLSDEVNVQATRALLGDAAAAGVERIVFASTCSNYGRMADPSVAVDESAPLRPVSLYAEQKVAIERMLLEQPPNGGVTTCLRLATIYGVGERMRFDLTVNEFTRELWHDRPLEVFGEQFWRPYLHVIDAARAVGLVLRAPEQRVSRRVFNVGHSDENYRKLDLVDIIRAHIPRGHVRYVHRDEDPRDYRVDFSRIRDELGFEPAMRVPQGVAEVAHALDAGRFGDPYSPGFSNV
jgi:nucleoside-diphosphate-sugar epimerase